MPRNQAPLQLTDRKYLRNLYTQHPPLTIKKEVIYQPIGNFNVFPYKFTVCYNEIHPVLLLSFQTTLIQDGLKGSAEILLELLHKTLVRHLQR
jgi:hypothetical protein